MSTIKSLHWDITKNCNLRCKHCYNADKYFNEKSDKPFLVEISLGIAEFCSGPQTDIQQVIATADQFLYEAKKHRRKSIRRPSFM